MQFLIIQSFWWQQEENIKEHLVIQFVKYQKSSHQKECKKEYNL